MMKLKKTFLKINLSLVLAFMSFGCFNWNINDFLNHKTYPVCDLKSALAYCFEFTGSTPKDFIKGECDQYSTYAYGINGTIGYYDNSFCSRSDCIATCLGLDPFNANAAITDTVNIYFYSSSGTGYTIDLPTAKGFCDTVTGHVFIAGCD